MTRARRGLGLATVLGLATTGLIASPAFAEDAPTATAVPDGPAVAEITWTAETGGDLGSASSRGSCDVNGDGAIDTVVGDWWWKRGAVNNAGAAYVLLGGENPVGGPIGTGAEVGAVRIDGPPVPNAFAGMSVSCLNDVNGDGLDDVIVGSNRTQRVWVILGAENFEPVDVESLGARGFEVTSSVAVAANAAPGGSANFGYSVSRLGDVNGDGLADFAITDNLYDRPANPEAGTAAADNIGRVWVIAGSSDVSTVDVDGAGASRVLFTIDGSGGQILSAEDVGDVNGDGLADIVAGSYAATPWGASAPVAGAAYAVFGSAERESVDAGDLGDRGFAIYGPQRGRDRLGTAVAAVGDLNGDGKADFVVGGDGVPNAQTGPRAGGAAVVFGSDSTATVFTDPAGASSVYSCSGEAGVDPGTCADPAVSRGYWIDGAVDNDKFGFSVASTDDINGDGLPEVLVGAWGHDSAGSNAGAAYAFYGRATGGPALSAASLTAEIGFRLDGAEAGAQLGRSVGGITDFDGNGVADIVAGANGKDYASVFLLGAAKTKLSLETSAELSVEDGGTITASAAPARAAAGAVTGAVAFSIGGTAIAGCEAVPVEDGKAVCEAASFPTGGEQKISAVFTDESGAFTEASAELTVQVAAPPAPPACAPFKDVPSNHKFAKDICWLKAEKITTGNADGTFGPKNAVSREAMAAFLYRYAGSPKVSVPAKGPFKDVPKSHKFAKEITWLKSEGITTGNADGTFGPKNAVSREAMAAFLYRYADSPKFAKPTKAPFSDVPANAKFAKQIAWLSSTKITTGNADGSFKPKSAVSREAMAAFLHRYDAKFGE